MRKTTRRQKIAAVLWAIAFPLLFGTVGNWDLGYDITAFDIVKIIIGMALLIISVPVSGELDTDNNDEEEKEDEGT